MKNKNEKLILAVVGILAISILLATIVKAINGDMHQGMMNMMHTDVDAMHEECEEMMGEGMHGECEEMMQRT